MNYMPTSQLEIIKKQSQGLPAEERVALIKFLADTLSVEARPSVPIEFGKYHDSGKRPSSDDDFTVAEWNPSESELNGN